VHQSGYKAPQQLPLPEHDLELRASLARRVRAAVVRDGLRDEPVEEDRSPRRAQAGERDERG
jgi:hypothetical protein